jgi:DNA mismatch endonuclease (patch repair protein)
MGVRRHQEYLSDSKTSFRMKRVKRRNTGPEEAVQKFLLEQGLNFKLHAALPGSPDIILPESQKAIFVHGCYWHRHRCSRATVPLRNRKLWTDKFEKNKKRDRRNRRLLRKSGWTVLTIWECQILRSTRWKATVRRFLQKDCG